MLIRHCNEYAISMDQVFSDPSKPQNLFRHFSPASAEDIWLYEKRFNDVSVAEREYRRILQLEIDTDAQIAKKAQEIIGHDPGVYGIHDKYLYSFHVTDGILRNLQYPDHNFVKDEGRYHQLYNLFCRAEHSRKLTFLAREAFRFAIIKHLEEPGDNKEALFVVNDNVYHMYSYFYGGELFYWDFYRKIPVIVHEQ